MIGKIHFVLILATAAACTGCPLPYTSKPTELEGTWRATDGTVLEIKWQRVRVLFAEPISYPQNDPASTGYAYHWCKASFTLQPDLVPKQINITYPRLIDDDSTFVYCTTDPSTLGFNFTLTSGNLTEQQLDDIQADYVQGMLDNLDLSGETALGIYEIIDHNHVSIALGDLGAGRPSTFDEAKTYTRDTRKYASQSLGSFCGGS